MLKSVILDFDGVILESCDIKTMAFRELFKNFPGHVNEMVDYHLNHGGVSRYKKFQYFYENILNENITPEKLDELGKQFSELVLEEVKKCDFVFGAEEFLEKYSKKLKLFVASGTPETELRTIIRERGLAKFFRGVYGTPATKSEIINNILEKEGLFKDEVIFVGDSPTDFKEAHKAGVPFVARLVKNQNFKLDTERCLYTVKNLKELISFLSNSVQING